MSINKTKLYRNNMHKIISTVCLLLIGLHLSCGIENNGGTTPTINYNPLKILSFSVLDNNKNLVSDTKTNTIPVDASFLLTFDQLPGDMADHVSHLASQIKLSDMGRQPHHYSVETTPTSNQVKIDPTTDLSYGTTYQLIIKKDLTIGNYQVTNATTYIITTEKSSDSSLIVVYNNKEILPNGNNMTILLPSGSDESSVTFTLKIGEGATLQGGHNNDLPLNENNQYITNMDFSGNKKYDFTVIAQDGNTSATYSVGVLQQQADSKEIVSFAFLQSDNLHLKANIAMDINGQNITKTVTNVEGITGLTPYIVHSGSDISPASGVVQNFSTNNTYTVTAIDQTTSNYTVTLTGYYGVTINTNGGLITGAPTTTGYVIYGTQAISPSDPSQKHYGFKGWYDLPDKGNIFNFNTDITTKTIVYAQWTNKQYQVRFYRGNNHLGTIPVASLTAIPASYYPVSSISGKIYKWYSDNGLVQIYDISAQVTNDLILYADEITVSFKTIIENGIIPTGLANYGRMSEQIFSRYTAGATVVARYVKEKTTGTGDGSSWDNAANDIQVVVDGIDDAIENKIYVVLLASGTYNPATSYTMKNHIALVGGFIAGSYDQGGETYLDGDNNKRVLNNNNNSLNSTALLYGVTITNGNLANYGGGMYNNNSSPTLINVTFSDNKSDSGGGMYNNNSSPTLINVTFSGNGNGGMGSFGRGGGTYNQYSFPILINVTFSENTNVRGGGMYNYSSSPTLINVTFSSNRALFSGGGMYNYSSSPTLINVTFSDNMRVDNMGFEVFRGGGIYHDGEGQPLTLINTILWNNDNGNILLHNDNGKHNDNGNFTETVNLYYSLIEGGTNASTTATGILLYRDDTTAHPISINGESFITNDPGLGILVNHGGGVDAISIGATSPARDKGIYVKGVKTGNSYPEANLYYSTDNTSWFSDPGLTSSSSLPGNADDLTATDARGYGRVGRPDMGAYEVGGTP